MLCKVVTLKDSDRIHHSIFRGFDKVHAFLAILQLTMHAQNNSRCHNIHSFKASPGPQGTIHIEAANEKAESKILLILQRSRHIEMSLGDCCETLASFNVVMIIFTAWKLSFTCFDYLKGATCANLIYENKCLKQAVNGHFSTLFSNDVCHPGFRNCFWERPAENIDSTVLVWPENNLKENITQCLCESTVWTLIFMLTTLVLDYSV